MAQSQSADQKIHPKIRNYISDEIDGLSFGPVRKEFKKIINYDVQSAEDLVKIMEHYSEVYAVIEEQAIRKYVKTAGYSDTKYQIQLVFYGLKIIVPGFLKRQKLYKLVYKSPYFEQLPDESYLQLKRILRKENEMYKFKNMLLMLGELLNINTYSKKIGKLSVQYDGKETTLTKLTKFWEDPDRNKREETWKLYYSTVQKNKKKFDKLFDKMKKIRIRMSKNAYYENYRDYIHDFKGRFDYTPEDCFKFHSAVENVVVPFVSELNKKKVKELKIDKLQPWDEQFDIPGEVPKPYEDMDDLVEKMVKIFSSIKPEYGKNLKLMKENGLLDLPNRKGKSPGAFTVPMANHGASFILQNAVGLHGDIETLAHEGGHAMHNFVCSPLKIAPYREPPFEIAEVASMAMEFLILDHLNVYYDDEDYIKRLKNKALEDALKFLPWCMIVDAFQQWIYTNPDHNEDERSEYFISLLNRFKPDIDWSEVSSLAGVRWIKQSHIFQMPFYYIEYGIAQLGALSIYRNYRNDPQKTIEQYHKFLSLCNSKPMKEVYEAAGIKFDFSEEYISEIVEFVKNEIGNN